MDQANAVGLTLIEDRFSSVRTHYSCLIHNISSVQHRQKSSRSKMAIKCSSDANTANTVTHSSRCVRYFLNVRSYGNAYFM